MRLPLVIRALAASLALVHLTGCIRFVTAKSVDDMAPGESLVIGSVNCVIKGEHQKRWNLLVRNQQTGTESQHPAPDDSGVFAAHLPPGTYELRRLIGGNGLRQHFFGAGEATFQVGEAGDAYYIGELVVDWTPPKGDIATIISAGMVGGAVTAGYVSKVLGKSGVSIGVRDEQDAAQRNFAARFRTSMVLTPALLQLAAPRVVVTEQP